MKPVLVFDLNETLIDLSGLDPEFTRVFRSAGARKEWFKVLLQLVLTATIIDQYRSFDRLADAALQLLAAQRRQELSSADRKALLAKIPELDAHTDVRTALERLKSAGFRIAILSNSTEKSARAHVEHNGLSEYFEKVLSADTVGRYKPAREAYESAAEALDVGVGDIRLIAAHAWDISGALSAGCKAAFVKRPDKALDPDAKQPDIIGTDLNAVAAEIIDRGR